MQQLLTNTQQNLRTDDTGITGVRSAASVVDEETERNHEEKGSGHNERFQLANPHDDEAENNTRDDGNEAVKGCDSRCAKNRFVKADNENCV